MYLLRCPQGHQFPVSPTAAGSQVTCPECGSTQTVPKLGELRKLPRADEVSATKRRGGLVFGARIAFALLLMVALIAGITSGYAALRWQTLPIPPTSEQHIAAAREEIAAVPPATLITIWDQYETGGLGEPTPFLYVHLQEVRDGWKRVCLTGLAVAGGCLVAAVVVVVAGRSRSSARDT